MQKLPLRLLLNAEPFGFGPTAAIAAFFPLLRPHFETIAYMGKRHTLDLQRSLPYDVFHDLTDVPKEDRKAAHLELFKNYDIVLSAMDHKVIEWAQLAGLKTFYYDALAWYWPDIPGSVRSSDLYMAQDFFGVKDRLTKEFPEHYGALCVPPIVPPVMSDTERDIVLINLGGLQNPYWPVENIAAFARATVNSLRAAIPAHENVVITSSVGIAGPLHDLGVITAPRSDMEKLLMRSKIAFMTPGLGNIYDAAAYNIPTVWLPPANDSQGRQLRLLHDNGMVDRMLDWDGFCRPVNYHDNQMDVLKAVADAADSLAHDATMRNRLECKAREAFTEVAQQSSSQTVQLLDRFGNNGARRVADRVVQTARGYCHG